MRWEIRDSNQGVGRYDVATKALGDTRWQPRRWEIRDGNQGVGRYDGPTSSGWWFEAFGVESNSKVCFFVQTLIRV